MQSRIREQQDPLAGNLHADAVVDERGQARGAVAAETSDSR